MRGDRSSGILSFFLEALILWHKHSQNIFRLSLKFWSVWYSPFIADSMYQSYLTFYVYSKWYINPVYFLKNLLLLWLIFWNLREFWFIKFWLNFLQPAGLFQNYLLLFISHFHKLSRSDIYVDLFFLLDECFIDIKFPLHTTLAVFHKVWLFMSSFSFLLKASFVFLFYVISDPHEL